MAALGITRSPQATAAAGGAAGGAVGTGGKSKQTKSGAVGKFITPIAVTMPDRNESFQFTILV
jgi:hypothetical protein